MLTTEQIAVQLPRVLLDALVTGGIYESRAAAVRAGVEAITALERRQQTDRAIVAGYRHTPPTSREHDSAIASRRHRRGTLVSEPRRAEVWWGEIQDLGRFPFLVMTRSAAIPVLGGVLSAPVARTVRNIPTGVSLGPDDAMPTSAL